MWMVEQWLLKSFTLDTVPLIFICSYTDRLKEFSKFHNRLVRLFAEQFLILCIKYNPIAPYWLSLGWISSYSRRLFSFMGLISSRSSYDNALQLLFRALPMPGSSLRNLNVLMQASKCIMRHCYRLVLKRRPEIRTRAFQGNEDVSAGLGLVYNQRDQLIIWFRR